MPTLLKTTQIMRPTHLTRPQLRVAHHYRCNTDEGTKYVAPHNQPPQVDPDHLGGAGWDSVGWTGVMWIGAKVGGRRGEGG